MLAVQAEGAKVVTVEGSRTTRSHAAASFVPQASMPAMRLLHAGYDQTAHVLLSEEPDCDAARVREVLSGNLLPLHRLHLDRRGRPGGARRL